MPLLETYEQMHLATFHRAESLPLPSASFRTPDGRRWSLPTVLAGWRPRISDAWSWRTLHGWIAAGKVQVRHVELPDPSGYESGKDRIWTYIDRTFGPGEPEPHHACVGRGDLGMDGLIVEFGTCAPLKFVLNLGYGLYDQMIVPVRCPYAFVFTPQKRPITKPKENET